MGDTDDLFGGTTVIEYPKKGTKLFQETDNYYEFAHFGWGMRSSFYGFIKGYKGVSDRAVDDALASRDISILDTYIFPIVFSYRHFVELSLKALYLDYSTDAIDVKKTKFANFNHNLMSVWNEIEPMLLEVSGKDNQVVKNAKSYVEQYHSADKSSFNYRYPITKSLEVIHVDEKRIDLSNLKERMNELSNYFDGADGALDNLRSSMQDQEEYRNELRAEWEAEMRSIEAEMRAEWEREARAEWEAEARAAQREAEREARAEWEAEARAAQREAEAEARAEWEAEARAEAWANRERE